MNPYINCTKCKRPIRKNLLSRHKCQELSDEQIEKIVQKQLKSK